MDSDGDSMLDVESATSSDEGDDRRMGMSAFASAEEWDERIQQDIAAEGSSPAPAVIPATGATALTKLN